MNTRALVAEAIGTFALVFVGAGAMVVDAVTGGGVGHVGISLAFGLVVMAMIYAVGDVSGAHFNPAVTLGFWWADRFPGSWVGPYLACQFGAALFASALLRLSFPEAATWGETLPHAGIGAALVFEIVLTSFLVFVILGITTEGRIEGGFAGLAIGATVTLASLAGGPVSGASMNPARSFGPAIVSGEWASLPLYFGAPLLGAWIAVRACRLVRGEACCTQTGSSEMAG